MKINEYESFQKKLQPVKTVKEKCDKFKKIEQ